MKTFVILGAGQFGQACALLFNTNHYRLAAFGDNNPKLWGTVISHPLGMEIPVCPIPEALALKPDAAVTGVIGAERTGELLRQARDWGYTGNLYSLQDFYEQADLRSATLLRLAARLHAGKIPGDLAELGVYRGDLAWKLNALFPDRTLYLFDTFTGFDRRDLETERSHGCSFVRDGEFSDTSVQSVLSRFPHPERAVLRQGYFPETAQGMLDTRYALVSLDADLYAPLLAGLTYFYPRLSRGGMILLHDYNNARFPGAKKAVEDYEALHGPLLLVPLCDLHGSAVILHP